MVVASPEFIDRHGFPKHPTELTNLPCLAHSSHATDKLWQFREQGQLLTVRVNGPMHANNNLALKQGLLASLGIGYLPRYQVKTELADGRLIELLPEFLAPATPVHAVYRHRQHLSAAMRATLDYLVARL